MMRAVVVKARLVARWKVEGVRKVLMDWVERGEWRMEGSFQRKEGRKLEGPLEG
jgi:hypothetical protein